MSPRHIDTATRDAREEELTHAALSIMAEEGVSGLTIDKVVARVPYSKGTVYNHFCCKEDLLMALCNNCIEDLLPLFSRAAGFAGSSREQILAIGYAYMLFAQLHPMKFMLVISAKTPAVMERASEAKRQRHQQLETALIGQLLQVILRAIDARELALAPDSSPQQVAFALWSMSFGTIALLHESVDRCGIRTRIDLESALVQHSNLVLDGLHWTPYSTAHDSGHSVSRIRQELFARELEQLHSNTPNHMTPQGGNPA